MRAFSFRQRLAMAAAGAAVLGAVLPAAAAEAAPHGPISTVNVPAYGSWVDTYTYLRTDLALVTGQGAVFSGGEIFGPYGDSSCVAPVGAPAPGLPCDALVGKIGSSGTPFVVGNSDYVHVAWHGELYLAVNTTGALGGFHSTVLQLP
jgi:hypothetical protein